MNQRKRFMPYRAAALFLLFAMLFPPGYSRPLQAAGRPESIAVFPDDPADITPPSGTGETVETYKGSGEKLIILIQDAHGIPDAQRSIRKLVHYFSETYGVRLAGVEGASLPFDPVFLRSFPDRAVLEAELEPLMKKGELAGSTASALLDGAAPFARSPVEYHGIEDWELYETGLREFLRGYTRTGRIEDVLKTVSSLLSEDKKKIYSADLLEIGRIEEDLFQEKINLIEALKRLKPYGPPREGSDLSLLVQGAEKGENDDPGTEIRAAAEKVRKALDRNISGTESEEDLRRLNAAEQLHKTSGLSSGEFALLLQEISGRAGLNLSFTEAIHRTALHHKRIRDIKGTAIFEEFEIYLEELKNAFIKNEEERELERLSRKARLYGRLARFELTRSGWEEIKRQAEPAMPAPYNAAFEGLRSDLEAHFSYYESAEKRDAIFLARMLDLMEKKASRAGILISGGFHAEGLARGLRGKNISYLLLRPGIKDLPEENVYYDLMRGKVSWMDYFRVEDGKINTGEAFLRYLRDRLSGLEETRRGEVLKQWRDEIIRNLAAGNRIEESRKYTRYIDEVLSGSGAAPVNEWRRNVDGFLAKVYSLKESGRLTEQNVINILQPSAYQPPVLVPLAAEPVSVEVLPAAARSELRAGEKETAAERTEEGDALSAVLAAGIEAFDRKVRALEFSIYRDSETQHSSIISRLNFLRTFWDEIEQGLPEINQFGGAEPELRLDPKKERWLYKLFTKLVQQQSSFFRYREYDTTKDFDLEEEAYKKILAGQRSFNVSVFGPGLLQEPIDITMMIHRAAQRAGISGEEIQLTFSIFDRPDAAYGELQRRFRENRIFYSPEDIAILEREGFPVGRYFAREERGYRLRDEYHGNFRFVFADLDVDDLSKLPEELPPQDFIYANTMLFYLHPESLSGTWKLFYGLLKDGGSLYSNNFEYLEKVPDRPALPAALQRILEDSAALEALKTGGKFTKAKRQKLEDETVIMNSPESRTQPGPLEEAAGPRADAGASVQGSVRSADRSELRTALTEGLLYPQEEPGLAQLRKLGEDPRNLEIIRGRLGRYLPHLSDRFQLSDFRAAGRHFGISIQIEDEELEVDITRVTFRAAPEDDLVIGSLLAGPSLGDAYNYDVAKAVLLFLADLGFREVILDLDNPRADLFFLNVFSERFAEEIPDRRQMLTVREGRHVSTNEVFTFDFDSPRKNEGYYARITVDLEKLRESSAARSEGRDQTAEAGDIVPRAGRPPQESFRHEEARTLLERYGFSPNGEISIEDSKRFYDQAFQELSEEEHAALLRFFWEEYAPVEGGLRALPPSLADFIIKNRALFRDEFHQIPFAAVSGLIIQRMKTAGISKADEVFIWKVYHERFSRASNRKDYLTSNEEIKSKVNALPPGVRLKVLDIGSGAKGAAIENLANAYGEKVEVSGIDLAPETQPPKAFAVKGDILRLPFPDNYFDVVAESNVLIYFKTPEQMTAALSEVLRVMKDDGFFLMWFDALNWEVNAALEKLGADAYIALTKEGDRVIRKGKPDERSELRTGEVQGYGRAEEILRSYGFDPAKEVYARDAERIYETLFDVLSDADHEALFLFLWKKAAPFAGALLEIPEGLVRFIIENRGVLRDDFHLMPIGEFSAEAIKKMRAAALPAALEPFVWRVFHERYPASSNRENYLKNNKEIKRRIDALRPGARLEVLDIGAGPRGAALRNLAREYGDKVNAAGIDLDAQETSGSISLMKGDARLLPFPDGRFDAAYESKVLMYFHTADLLRPALREILRVLKEGGVLILSSDDMEALIGEVLAEIEIEAYTDRTPEGDLVVSKGKRPEETESKERSELRRADTVERLISETGKIIAAGLDKFRGRDERLANAEILESVKSFLGAVPHDFFLHGKTWYLRFILEGAEYFHAYSADGASSRASGKEEFTRAQIAVPDRSRFRLFETEHVGAGFSLLWGWKDYDDFVRMKRAREITRRLDEITDQVMEAVRAREAIPPHLNEEAGELLAERERERYPEAALIPQNAGSLERHADLFRETAALVETILEREIEAASAAADALTLLQRVKADFRNYRIGAAGFYGPALPEGMILGIKDGTIVMREDLWESVTQSPDAKEIMAEIVIRAVLEALGPANRPLSALLGERMGGRLAAFEQELRTAAALSQREEKLDLLRAFSDLEEEEETILNYLITEDPTFFFSPPGRLGYIKWDKIFERLGAFVEGGDTFRRAGIEDVFQNAREEIDLRAGSAPRRERFKAALERIESRFKSLRAVILRDLDSFSPASFTPRQWEWAARLDPEIKARLTAPGKRPPDLLSKGLFLMDLTDMRLAELGETPEDLVRLSARPELGLEASARYYETARAELEEERRFHLGDIESVTEDANIIMYQRDYSDQTSANRADIYKMMRSEAVKYLMRNIKRLPKPLMWKVSGALNLNLKFSPIPEDLKEEIPPQLAAAHFARTYSDQITLEMIGYPNVETLDLQHAGTTLDHEIVHNLSFAKSSEGKDLLPIEDFKEIAALHGFEWLDFDRDQLKAIRSVSDINTTRERDALSNYAYIWTDPTGQKTAILTQALIDLHPRKVQAMQDAGIEIVVDSPAEHLFSSPEEVVAMVSTEPSENYESRSRGISAGLWARSREILQRNLLRSQYPAAERSDGKFVYEVYTPNGEEGYVTGYESEGVRYSTLREALSAGFPDRADKNEDPSLRAGIPAEDIQAPSKVVAALRPDSGTGLGRSELRWIVASAAADFEAFKDSIETAWMLQSLERPGEEINPRLAKAVKASEEALLAALRTGKIPAQGLSVAAAIPAGRQGGFFEKLMRAIRESGIKTEFLAEGEVLKTLPKDVPNLSPRAVTNREWTGGVLSLRNGQGRVPVAFDENLPAGLHGLFSGLKLAAENEPNVLIRDYAELLFAVSLLKLAEIYSDPGIIKLLDAVPDAKGKGELLKAELLSRLPDFGSFETMFSVDSGGHLSIAGNLVRNYLAVQAAQTSA